MWRTSGSWTWEWRWVSWSVRATLVGTVGTQGVKRIAGMKDTVNRCRANHPLAVCEQQGLLQLTIPGPELHDDAFGTIQTQLTQRQQESRGTGLVKSDRG